MARCGTREAFLLPARCLALPGYGRRPRLSLWAALFLLLLSPLAAGACPEICRCSSGRVDCREHRLRFAPGGLPANATAILLDYNRIAVLQEGTFVAQSALRQLSLQGNALVSVHRQALAGLGQLEELDLSGNYLTLLLPGTFAPVPNLKMLHLGNNRLLRLPPELVGALPHLQVLSVQGNALTSLGPGFFESLPSLGHLRLDGNPWVCSCAIQPLSRWLVDNVDKVPAVESVFCKRPAALAHHPIAAIGNKSFALCQEPWLHPRDYAFFLLVGPSTFLTSICLCILAGLLAVARARVMATTYARPGALARRAERHQH
uniref:Leucine-rich repeat-containing protein 26 n=1 Tax=Pogona vitticeps TaxID=103695 RepID=A0ABM5F5F6_9SAUR